MRGIGIFALAAVLTMSEAVAQLCRETQKLELGDPLTVFVALDTEGTGRTGLREVAAVVVGDEDTYFFDTVTPAAKSEGLAPQDARRTWAHVGPRFWRWLSQLGDEVVVLAHNGAAHDAPLLNRETLLQCPDDLARLRGRPVSYTHLTLPTILRV